MNATRRRRGRERLVEKARHIFAARGFHATGIDAVIAEAGVARMTVYNNFESKEDLIEAVLVHTSDRVIAWLTREIDARPLGPGDRLLALFDLYETWFSAPDFHGCLFAKAAREYPGYDHPVHLAAQAHLRRLFNWLERRCRNLGARDPAMLAQQILVLLEGATTVAEVSGATIAARRARSVAEVLIREA